MTKQCAEQVESFRRWAAAFRHAPQRDHDDGSGEREVDEKNPAPGSVFDQPAAEDGTERHGDGGKAGPGADGAAALLLGKEALMMARLPGVSKRGAQSLKSAGGDQLMDGLRHPASSRGKGEQRDAYQKNTTAAKEVASGTSDQDQCAEKQSVGLNYPLHVDDSCVEAGLEGGQGDIDHRAIDEGHAGAEDGSSEDPGSRAGLTGDVGGAGADGRFIAGRPHAGLGCDRGEEDAG